LETTVMRRLRVGNRKGGMGLLIFSVPIG